MNCPGRASAVFVVSIAAVVRLPLRCGGVQGPESRYVDWAALGERCRLWTFLAKFECIIIDDWQVSLLRTVYSQVRLRGRHTSDR